MHYKIQCFGYLKKKTQLPTKNSDEERLIDHFVALWIFKVKFKGEAASTLSFFMDIFHKAWCKKDKILLYGFGGLLTYTIYQIIQLYILESISIEMFSCLQFSDNHNSCNVYKRLSGFDHEMYFIGSYHWCHFRRLHLNLNYRNYIIILMLAYMYKYPINNVHM